MKSKLPGLLAATAALLASAVNPAQADNLRNSFTDGTQYWQGNLVKAVRLTNSGALSLTFTNPLSGIVSVTYTAECQLIASPSSYLAISVLIDGALVVPSGSTASFCSGRGAGIGGGRSRNSITVARTLASGPHAVSVQAQALGIHTGAWLGDTTILIAR